MIFSSVTIEEALGGIAVHSIRKGRLVLRKGTLIGAEEVEALRREGIATFVIARANSIDVSENEAASSLAQSSAAPMFGPSLPSRAVRTSMRRLQGCSPSTRQPSIV